MVDDVIHILVADDHPMMREGIAAVLNGENDMTVCWEAGNGLEAVELYRVHQPDVVVMDLRMPGMGGVQAVEIICEEFSEARILVLTTYEGDVEALMAMRAGANALLLKSALRRELVESVRAVHEGKRHLAGLVVGPIAEEDLLTAREVVVLECLAHGRANRVVASDLGISEETVKAHLRSIYAKLKAKDRTHAVTIGLRRGIIAR